MVRQVLMGLVLCAPVVCGASPVYPFSQVARQVGLTDAQILAVDGIEVPVDPQRSSIELAVVDRALSAVGVPYRFGRADLKSGVDCSGLVRAAFHSGAGISLPHNAALQARHARPVARGREKPGDLIFFNTRGHKHSHVGLITGHRQFVHASVLNRRVTVASLDNRYWRTRLTESRRILPSDSEGGTE